MLQPEFVSALATFSSAPSTSAATRMVTTVNSGCSSLLTVTGPLFEEGGLHSLWQAISVKITVLKGVQEDCKQLVAYKDTFKSLFFVEMTFVALLASSLPAKGMIAAEIDSWCPLLSCHCESSGKSGLSCGDEQRGIPSC